MKINYVLFTHLPNNHKAWKAFEKNAKELGRILNHSNTPGMLAVFIDPGWVQLLNIIGQDFNPELLTKGFNAIKESEDKFNAIIENNPVLNGRVRLITAKTLYPILNNIRGNKPGSTAEKLKRYLVADNPGVRYDTTKVVEAIIRIRHLGTGISVLRMDWDALFNKTTLEGRDLLLVTEHIPRECEHLAKNHRIYSYMISGSYEMPDNPNGDYSSWNINGFNTAFATRMFPALIPNKAVCDELNGHVITDQNLNTGEKLDGELNESVLKKLAKIGMFDLTTMKSYYGLGLLGNEGLSSIGSDPLSSVISGSALVLSDGAILDLPPFSNFKWNVMWIDDFLK